MSEDRNNIQLSTENKQATRQRNAILLIALIAVIVFGLTVLIIWRWKKSKP